VVLLELVALVALRDRVGLNFWVWWMGGGDRGGEVGDTIEDDVDVLEEADHDRVFNVGGAGVDVDAYVGAAAFNDLIDE
jgi:hypothetical protein